MLAAPILIALPILFFGGFLDLLLGGSWIEVYKYPAFITTLFTGLIGLGIAIANLPLPPEEKEEPVGLPLFIWSVIIFLSFFFYTGSTS